MTFLEPSPSSLTPKASPSPLVAANPKQLTWGTPLTKNHHPYHLIYFFFGGGVRWWRLGDLGLSAGPSSIFREFSYKEIKKATGSFNIIIGQEGLGTVYKAQFSDSLVAAVKRMNEVSEQGDDDFCREIELLARLHHRHLVALRGFCIAKHERFLMYEHMANGSLKEHLHAPGRNPLSWRTRMQIAIDMANALVIYRIMLIFLAACRSLHFYCDPPLCHIDIKSSNILLDENFVAMLADFGLTHASKDGSICFEPVYTEIRGKVIWILNIFTQELTEKSDVFSYSVLRLEIVTARQAIQDNKNLVEWSQTYMNSESRLHELVDPSIRHSFDLDQLQTLVSIERWCTQREG